LNEVKTSSIILEYLQVQYISEKKIKNYFFVMVLVSTLPSSEWAEQMQRFSELSDRWVSRGSNCSCVKHVKY